MFTFTIIKVIIISMKRKIFKAISMALVVFILFFLFTTLPEYVVINNEIESFMERGELVNTDIIKKIKYYEVPRRSGEIDKPSFTSYYGDKYAFAGSYGDTLVTQESPFFQNGVDIPVAYEFVSFWFGGHAAIISDEFDEDDYPEIIEATALSQTPENNAVTKTFNYWLYQEYRDNFIGLRVKGATKEEYQSYTNWAKEQLGTPYNMTFIFNTENTFYCSDLVSKGWGELGYNLNKDAIVTTINDIISSEDTYIFFYKYSDRKTGYQHIYYHQYSEN